MTTETKKTGTKTGTKAIREALLTLGLSHDVSAAWAEVKAIEEAAQTLNRLHLGDFTTSIRDSEEVRDTTPDDASTWDHPDVKAWSDAAGTMRAVAANAPKEGASASVHAPETGNAKHWADLYFNMLEVAKANGFDSLTDAITCGRKWTRLLSMLEDARAVEGVFWAALREVAPRLHEKLSRTDMQSVEEALAKAIRWAANIDGASDGEGPEDGS